LTFPLTFPKMLVADSMNHIQCPVQKMCLQDVAPVAMNFQRTEPKHLTHVPRKPEFSVLGAVALKIGEIKIHDPN